MLIAFLIILVLVCGAALFGVHSYASELEAAIGEAHDFLVAKEHLIEGSAKSEFNRLVEKLKGWL